MPNGRVWAGRNARRALCTTLLVVTGLLAGTPAVPAAQSAKPVVVLETSLGEIRIELEIDRAPVTARNFLRYVDSKRYDGATFYRALTQGPGGSDGLVQGGVQSRPRYALAPIAHESTVDTGLSHVEGAVSMARGITPSPSPWIGSRKSCIAEMLLSWPAGRRPVFASRSTRLPDEMTMLKL